jgi:hypothetical protein
MDPTDARNNGTCFRDRPVATRAGLTLFFPTIAPSAQATAAARKVGVRAASILAR